MTKGVWSHVFFLNTNTLAQILTWLLSHQNFFTHNKAEFFISFIVLMLLNTTRLFRQDGGSGSASNFEKRPPVSGWDRLVWFPSILTCKGSFLSGFCDRRRMSRCILFETGTGLEALCRFVNLWYNALLVIFESNNFRRLCEIKCDQSEIEFVKIYLKRKHKF